MPGLIRKLLVVAAVEGLVLQPLPQRSQKAAAPVIIDYKNHAVRPYLRDVHEESDVNNASMEVHGVIGVFKIASAAYLIAISRRKQVAQVFGKPIYCITGVVILPVSSEQAAIEAIDRARIESHQGYTDDHESQADDATQDADTISTSEDGGSHEVDVPSSIRPSLDDLGRQGSGQRRDPGIAEEVINNKGSYGRFTERWFSKRGWNTSAPGSGQSLGSTPETQDDRRKDDQAHQKWPQTPAQTPAVEKSLEDSFPGLSTQDLTTSLLPKLLTTTRLLFDSGTFFYSYEYDITRDHSQQSKTMPDVPLSRRADHEYFYNSHLTDAFATEGYHEYVLPVMQGCVGQRTFSLKAGSRADDLPPLPKGSHPPEHVVEASVSSPDSNGEGALDIGLQTFLLTIISRRSTRRAGLRYLRRGIDETGNVANTVETEQILSSPTWDNERRTYSFLQTRGSIPLFFSQLPYTFKPPPKLLASEEANMAAMRKHFANLSGRYGKLQAISLVDRHGPEEQIGEAYQSAVARLNESGEISGQKVNFEWFEFHNACRGMKFENVSILIDSMTPFIVASGYTTLQSSKRTTSQLGIVRTNCMDCLDRTNVVQSALGQYVLTQQLADQGFSIDLSTDPSTTWFNTLWADNGDAISRAYTGTSALKGDFTRTRKRNALGALTDLSLTLNRYYRNFFDDFFAQAAIDYLLGSVDESVFTEFEEHMTTADPAMDLDKARQSAITSASTVVIEEHEDLIHGWVMTTPAVPGTLRTMPFVEVLLLLTEKALYVVHYDWAASKPHGFERVELNSITAIRRGAYITETNTARQTDPKHNVGISIRYQPSTAEEGVPAPLIRVNTRSLENAVSDAWSITGSDGHREVATSNDGPRTLAFKALSARSSTARTGSKPVSESDSIRQISEEILHAIEKDRRGVEDTVPVSLEQRDILSKEEARRSTGYIESLAFSVKKAIWG